MVAGECRAARWTGLGPQDRATCFPAPVTHKPSIAVSLGDLENLNFHLPGPDEWAPQSPARCEYSG